MGTKLNSNTLNVLQLAIGFFLIFFAFNSQGFIEETVLNSYADRGTIPKLVGYLRLVAYHVSFFIKISHTILEKKYLGWRWEVIRLKNE